MSLWDEIQKGNTVSYKRDNFSLEIMKKALNDMFNKERVKPTRVNLYMGGETYETFSDQMEYERNPSPELKAKIDARNLRLKLEYEENERIAREEFISLYGQEEFDFIMSLGRDINFRWCKKDNWGMDWSVPSEDEYVSYYIKFYKGIYSLEGDGGYGIGDSIEENITKERVLELIKNGYDGN